MMWMELAHDNVQHTFEERQRQTFEFQYHAVPVLNTAVQHVDMCDSGSRASSTVNPNTMIVK
jgi:hypothetical protein